MTTPAQHHELVKELERVCERAREAMRRDLESLHTEYLGIVAALQHAAALDPSIHIPPQHGNWRFANWLHECVSGLGGSRL